MSDYDDYRKDEARFFDDLDELAQNSAAVEWERRLREMAVRLDQPRTFLLRQRTRLIRQTMALRPDMSEAAAATWVDSVIGLDPSN
jgi:hypothetical protein